MIRFHHSNVLNHIKIIFLCSCCSSLGSPDIAQETGAKLHLSIAFSIERSPNFACFWAFRHLIFENQGMFGLNINRLYYSCGLLIAFVQILWAIIGWKTFLLSFFSGHWNFTSWITSDVIMTKIIGRAIAWQLKQSWPLPPGSDLKSENVGLPVELRLAHKHEAQSSRLSFSLACRGTFSFCSCFAQKKKKKNQEPKTPDALAG